MQEVKGLNALKTWAIQEKERLIAAGVFLALSLGLFLGLGIDWSTPAVKAVKRYMNAAIRCDTMGMYAAFDEEVVAWSLESYRAVSGVDTVTVEEIAQRQGAVMTGLMKWPEERGVKARFSYDVKGEEALDSATLAQLRESYTASGIDLELLDGRQVDLRVTITLTGEKGRSSRERDVTFTALQTPRGWSLELHNIAIFVTLLQEMNTFAWEYAAQ